MKFLKVYLINSPIPQIGDTGTLINTPTITDKPSQRADVQKEREYAIRHIKLTKPLRNKYLCLLKHGQQTTSLSSFILVANWFRKSI